MLGRLWGSGGGNGSSAACAKNLASASFVAAALPKRLALSLLPKPRGPSLPNILLPPNTNASFSRASARPAISPSTQCMQFPSLQSACVCVTCSAPRCSEQPGQVQSTPQVQPEPASEVSVVKCGRVNCGRSGKGDVEAVEGARREDPSKGEGEGPSRGERESRRRGGSVGPGEADWVLEACL